MIADKPRFVDRQHVSISEPGTSWWSARGDGATYLSIEEDDLAALTGGLRCTG